MPRSAQPSSDRSHHRSLTDREREIARRVRRTLHLPASMTEEEVAAELYDTFAWKRERMGLAREEARRALADAARPALTWMREQGRALGRHIRAFWRR